MLRLSKVPWASFFVVLIFSSTAVAQSAPEVIATTPSAPPSTETVEPEPEPALIREPPKPTQEERLGEWLDSIARAERSSRRSQGIFNIVGGSSLTALGGYWFASPTTGEDPSNPSKLQQGFGLLALALGGAGVGRGIYQLAVPSTAEEASEQYKGARSRGLSQKEFGRFEGMLATFSDEVQREHRRDRWRGLGWLLGGGLILGLTPVADLSGNDKEDKGWNFNEDRFLAYTTGGLMAFNGALRFGCSFEKVPNAWERYLDGEVPEPRKPTARVTPSVGRSYAGLSVSGTF
jgi:hypothetical protein